MFQQYAVNTLNASWLELKLAKRLGKKKTHKEGDRTITIVTFCGNKYLTDVVKDKVKDKDE